MALGSSSPLRVFKPYSYFFLWDCHVYLQKTAIFITINSSKRNTTSPESFASYAHIQTICNKLHHLSEKKIQASKISSSDDSINNEHVTANINKIYIISWPCTCKTYIMYLSYILEYNIYIALKLSIVSSMQFSHLITFVIFQ